ncbi:putative RNA polymerase II transcription factor SIII (Elongin) subunit A,putative [Purpureocillium lavendulum]|uniref:RNA polymerase II transcription factor SIII (Elongin) subunit A,putative n=1 Tax=Purpureocillium lavendulum TaxID=1247861 RepID=A0AB34G4Q3_9HYPO|nr:putative RNA polymerase II transcription factor SIII (Elongin) subunit A,putative [Purpureocillium lavendulum]
MSPVKSLMELAMMSCIKNIKSLESVGDYLLYDTVSSILTRVENAHQLRQIEINSPQIQGETAEIWIKIIERDFPLEHKATAYKPPSPDKWYKVWEKYKHEHDVALAESERKLKNALAGLQEDKERNVSKIVERKYLPRAGHVGPKRHWSQRDAGSSTLSFGGGSRTKTNTGASVMKKVRREAREIANIKTQLSKPIRAPIRAPTMKKAPAAMVNAHRRAALPAYRVSGASAVDQWEERATFISDSEDDDKDNKPAVPAAPAKKPVSDAAKVSLLKKRPGTAASTKPVLKKTVASPQTERASGAASSSTTAAPATAPKKVSALAGKLNRSAAINKVKPTSDKAPEKPEEASPVTVPPVRLPTRKSVSPPPGETGPTSPEEIIAALNAPAPAPPVQKKRKAPIDIFMRPKKRFH